MPFVGSIPVLGTSGGANVMRDLRIGRVYSRQVTIADLTNNLPNQSFPVATLPPLSFAIAAWVDLITPFTGPTATSVVAASGVVVKELINGQELLGVPAGIKNTSPGSQFDGSHSPLDLGGGELFVEIAAVDQNVDELTAGDVIFYAAVVVLS
ncbi:MAG: hypothetical protein NUW37_05975 [Planctomycetes bacterium]|nr:hypothetical protein [Planctomycetota bacterium]